MEAESVVMVAAMFAATLYSAWFWYQKQAAEEPPNPESTEEPPNPESTEAGKSAMESLKHHPLKTIGVVILGVILVVMYLLAPFSAGNPAVFLCLMLVGFYFLTRMVK
jgi:hypothetical protein